MAVIDYVEDWATRLRGRLYAQFKDDPDWILFCTAVLGPQAQSIEDAIQSLVAILDIDNAGGVVLDLIGRLVGQPRSAGVTQDDATYRLYLKARIAASRSEGDPESIYAVFALLYAGAKLCITQSPVRSFTLTISGIAITDAEAQAGLAFLGDAKEATDGAVMVWQEIDDAHSFTCAVATFATADVGAGVTSMAVDARPMTSPLWPVAGQVVIDPDLPTQETIAYTGVVAGVMHFAAATTQAHATGAALELAGDPGLGFGDDMNPATGGELAGAGAAA